MSKKLLHPTPISKIGERIVFHASISQPENVFNLVTYKRIMEHAKRLRQKELDLHQILASYNQKECSATPEWKQFLACREEFRSLIHEYRHRLPIHLLAQCPYCGAHILQPVDTFSLLGLTPSLNATQVYWGGPEWRESLPPKQRCRHALCATLSVNLNGLQPDDISGWILGEKTRLIDSAPHLMVWPLIARHTSAVMHALPIGRLDDEEPIHRYTAHFATYFAGDKTNLYTKEMWVPNDLGGPAMGLVQIDIDLLKWVKAGRLFWLNPVDTRQLMHEPIESFPYAYVEPKGWYYVLAGGQVDGPHSYYQVWHGTAPLHDESFSHTIE